MKGKCGYVRCARESAQKGGSESNGQCIASSARGSERPQATEPCPQTAQERERERKRGKADTKRVWRFLSRVRPLKTVQKTWALYGTAHATAQAYNNNNKRSGEGRAEGAQLDKEI